MTGKKMDQCSCVGEEKIQGGIPLHKMYNLTLRRKLIKVYQQVSSEPWETQKYVGKRGPFKFLAPSVKTSRKMTLPS